MCIGHSSRSGIFQFTERRGHAHDDWSRQRSQFLGQLQFNPRPDRGSRSRCNAAIYRREYQRDSIAFSSCKWSVYPMPTWDEWIEIVLWYADACTTRRGHYSWTMHTIMLHIDDFICCLARQTASHSGLSVVRGIDHLWRQWFVVVFLGLRNNHGNVQFEIMVRWRRIRAHVQRTFDRLGAYGEFFTNGVWKWSNWPMAI